MNSDKEQLPSEYYNAGLSDRRPYEDRAEILSKLTIPALMRDKSWTASSSTPDNFVQSYGARLVNNLTAKVGMSLFPSNASAFRFTPNSKSLQSLSGGDGSALEEINSTISSAQSKITDHLEALNTRNSVFSVVQQLVAVSSCIMEKKKGKGYKVHTLRNFVVSLDDTGAEYKMCIKELLNKLPDGIESSDVKEEYELYTQLEEVETDKWVMTQELDGEIVGKEQTFNDDTRPFAYQGWLWSQGEDYHRPFCDDYQGDLEALAIWDRTLNKGGMISSKNITFVDERTGRTRARDVRKATNGAIIQGRADDVTSFQHGKNYDYQIGFQLREELKRELAVTFLLNTTRDAERVTAEEKRQDAREAEMALASVYSMVSNSLIRRMVLWAMNDLGIKLKAINVDIVTGLDALGRSAEAQKLDELVTRGTQIGFANRFNQSTLANRYASYYNIDTEGLYKTDEELKQEQAQAMQQQAMQQGSEALMQSAGQTAGQAL